MKHSLTLRWITAAALCLVASAFARAENVRCPEKGSPAFVLTLPAGWTHSYDKNGTLMVASAGRYCGLSFSMNDDPATVKLSYDALHKEIFDILKVTDTHREQDTEFAGLQGKVYVATAKTNNIPAVMKLYEARVDARHVATLTVAFATHAPMEEMAALEKLLASVKIARAQ